MRILTNFFSTLWMNNKIEQNWIKQSVVCIYVYDFGSEEGEKNTERKIDFKRIEHPVNEPETETTRKTFMKKAIIFSSEENTKHFEKDFESLKKNKTFLSVLQNICF